MGGQNVPLHRRVVRFHNLSVDSGVMVVSIEPGSPAAIAGLADGDIIIGFGDQPVAGIDDLHRLLTEMQLGVKTPLKIIRLVEKKELVVVPQESPAVNDGN